MSKQTKENLKQAQGNTETGGVAPGTAVEPAKSHLPANLDFGHLAGQTNVGMEDADRESFALPFLVVLQKLSPQLDRNDPEYIEGANEGDFLNTATRSAYSGEEGIMVMHVAFKRSFTKWGLREKGGGYKGEYSPSDPIVASTREDEKRRNILPDGLTQLVDTRMHGVILLGGETPSPALISATSTQIKKSKRWMTSMQEMQKSDHLPTFAHVYKITTIPESNDQGKWMGLKVDYIGPVTEQEHIDAAVAFHTALTSGTRKMEASDKAGVAE
jgi:hypothetical protein